MLIQGSQLTHVPIMGLQTATEIARTVKPIIDPANLAIVAYEVDGSMLDTRPSLLRIADVRELSDIGMIIDSADELVAPHDIIKLEKIYDLGFELVGKQVIDQKGHKLGKIDDYTLDTDSFYVQQFNVKRPLMKSFGDTEHLVHRSQIVEINDKAIVVKSGDITVEPVRQTVRTYVNPFRSQNPQPEAIRRDQS